MQAGASVKPLQLDSDAGTDNPFALGEPRATPSSYDSPGQAYVSSPSPGSQLVQSEKQSGPRGDHPRQLRAETGRRESWNQAQPDAVSVGRGGGGGVWGSLSIFAQAAWAPRRKLPYATPGPRFIALCVAFTGWQPVGGQPVPAQPRDARLQSSMQRVLAPPRSCCFITTPPWLCSDEGRQLGIGRAGAESHSFFPFASGQFALRFLRGTQQWHICSLLYFGLTTALRGRLASGRQ